MAVSSLRQFSVAAIFTFPGEAVVSVVAFQLLVVSDRLWGWAGWGYGKAVVFYLLYLNRYLVYLSGRECRR